jgi:hypothetical protein
LHLFFDILHEKLEPLKLFDAAIGHREIYEAICKKDNEFLEKVFDTSLTWWSIRFKQENLTEE